MKQFRRFLEQDFESLPVVDDVVYCQIGGVNKLCRVKYIDDLVGIIRVSPFSAPNDLVTMSLEDEEAMETKKPMIDRIAVWIINVLLEQNWFSIKCDAPVGRVISFLIDWYHKRNKR